jgi:hypothetical protein
MTDFDHTLNALRMFIKKEIIDNYFAERNYLEEDLELFKEKEAAYLLEMSQVARLFAALYHALKSEEAVRAVCQLLQLSPWPFYTEYQQMTVYEKEAAGKEFPISGWTAKGRFKNLIHAIYAKLYQAVQQLRESYQSLNSHCRLYNEDVEKFNLNYDFSLIASQIEAIDGDQSVLSGGLSASDREALQARMLIRKQKVEQCQLLQVPELPPLKSIKSKLSSLLDRLYQP